MEIANRRVLLFALMLVSASASLARAQSGSISQPSLAAKEVFVANSAAMLIKFQLSCDDEDDEDTWDNFQLQSGSNGTYSCATLPHVWFRITTDGKSVQYQLFPGKRYFIGWNEAQKRWDIFLYQ